MSTARAAETPAGTDTSTPPPDPCDHVWRYRMIAHADPGLLPRLVAPVAKLGLVPDSCSFLRRDDGLAAIELAVSGLTQGQADHLRLVYSVLPAMRAVELAARPLGSGRHG
ncbi:MAG: hypothetical protein ACFCVH_14250 [Alphaproteobacteria bacterium]